MEREREREREEQTLPLCECRALVCGWSPHLPPPERPPQPEASHVRV